MTLLRSPLLGLLMALVMALTSQAMAVARAAPGPSGLIEICNSAGPVMVAVDENGQPVGHPHLCPEFAAHAFDIGGFMALPPGIPRSVIALRLVPECNLAQSRQRPRPQARGPPSSA